MLVLLAFIGGASATGNATGKVYDHYTGDALPNASVNLTNYALTYSANTTTNATGYYLFTGLPADSYNFKAHTTESRYTPRQKYFPVSNDATTTYHIKMYADPSLSQSVNFGVSEEVKKNTSIRLWWTSDLPTKGYIEYGTTTSYGSETLDDDYSYAHFVEITGLSEQTLYHYRIVSTDLHDANYNSSDYNFTTLSATALDNLVKAARDDSGLPKTYYVRKDGNDSNTGLTNDAGGAWLTIDHAVDTIDVGDTVLVQSGTYYETVSFSAAQAQYGHGIQTHHIRLVADGDVVIEGNNTRGSAFVIDSRSAHQGYIDIVGFKCYNHTDYQIYSLGAQNIIIENNTIKNGGMSMYLRDLADIHYSHILNNVMVNSSGIQSINSEYILIKNNSWTDFGGYSVNIGGQYLLATGNTVNNSNKGLNVAGASFATFQNNAVDGITDRSIRIGTGDTHAILICSNTITSPAGATYLVTQYPNTITTYTNNTFRNGAVTLKGDFTYIYNNSFDGMHITGGAESAGADVFGEKSVIENNQFVKGTVIIVDRQLDCNIKNNILDSVKFQSFGDPAENVRILNNVFYNTTDYAIKVDNGGKDVVIKNNIFYNVSGYCVENASGINVTIDYNCVWLNNTTAYYNVADSNTMYQDPRFADISSDDFHLKSQYGWWTGSAWTNDAVTSPCIDAGDPTSDYGNEPSPNGSRINMGAYGNTGEASKSSSYGAPSPTNLQSTKGTTWVNHTWDAGSGNVTDSYNVSINAVWHNTTVNDYYNHIGMSPETWSNITVWAFNNTDGISQGSVSQNIQSDATPWSPSNTAIYFNDTVGYEIEITTKTDGINIFSQTPTQADGNVTSFRLVVTI